MYYVVMPMSKNAFSHVDTFPPAGKQHSYCVVTPKVFISRQIWAKEGVEGVVTYKKGKKI